jgi:hypothetical protein
MSIKNTLSEKFSLIVYRTGQLSLRARLAMAGAIQNKPLINEMIKKALLHSDTTASRIYDL